MSYYEELGVSNDASPEEIRAAYRRKAKVNHPDKPGGEQAKMAETNRAYDTLISPARRLTYDRTGEKEQPKPVDQVSQAKVLRMVLEWLCSEGNSGNLIADVSARLDQEQARVNMQVAQMLKIVAMLQKRVKRLKRKGGGGDSLLSAVAHRIKEFEQQLEITKDQSGQIDRARTTLMTYEYDVEIPEPISVVAA